MSFLDHQDEPKLQDHHTTIGLDIEKHKLRNTFKKLKKVSGERGRT